MKLVERRLERRMQRGTRWLEQRLGAAKAIKWALRYVFPDHWSFLLGEIALYSFIILLLTGTFLTLFFQPSMSSVVYHGSYTHLNGVRMSEAYASTLNISFDVRGGLLMRQIHHWAAILFMAAKSIPVSSAPRVGISISVSPSASFSAKETTSRIGRVMLRVTATVIMKTMMIPARQMTAIVARVLRSTSCTVFSFVFIRSQRARNSARLRIRPPLTSTSANSSTAIK